MNDELAYTVVEAAKKARISRALLYRHIADGRLVTRKLGSRTIVLRSDLLRYLENAPRAPQGKLAPD